MRKSSISFLAVLLLCSPLGAQVPMTGAGLPKPATAAGYTGPGDIVSGAYGWWGLRAYNSATRGNKVANVCIPSDVTCTDLLSDATTGALVITTIGGSSCGVVTCTIKTLYDQSGNTHCSSAACDVTNSTIGNRPVLTLNCIGSLPCMTWTKASSQVLLNSNVVASQAQPITVSSAVNLAASGAKNTFFAMNNGGSGMFSSFSSTPTITFEDSSTLASATLSTATWYAFQGVGNGASSVNYVNGTTVNGSAGTDGIPSSTAVRIGQDGFGSFFGGTSVEYGIWPSGFSGGNLSSMNSNIRTYWGF